MFILQEQQLTLKFSWFVKLSDRRELLSNSIGKNQHAVIAVLAYFYRYERFHQ